MSKYYKEDLETDIGWLCESTNHPLTKEEAKEFIVWLLESNIADKDYDEITKVVK